MTTQVFFIEARPEFGETPIMNGYTGEHGTAHQRKRLFEEDYYIISRYNYAVFSDKTLYNLIRIDYRQGAGLRQIIFDYETGREIINKLLESLLTGATTLLEINEAVEEALIKAGKEAV